MKQRKKPSLRFKGFDNDWEQRKLGDIAEIVGGGTPDTNNKNYWNGDINWYAPAEIGDQIYVNSSERKITKEGYTNSSAKILPVGTVLFTSRAGIGKTAILTREGCTNQGFQSIVPHKNKLDSYFIFSRTKELQNYGEKVGAGSTFVEVSGKQMADMQLMMPSTLKEQQQIGLCLRQIDNLITLHQRKLMKLKKLKKAMLEKMFPQNGAKVPEIRFKGFTNDWEQRKLSDVAEIITGGTPSTRIVEYWNPPEVPWLSSGEVHKKYITSTDTMISRKGYENSSATMVRENSVLIALAGQGKTRGTVAINRIPLATNQSIAAMTFSDDIDPDYIFSNLENRYEELRSISSGDGSRGGLNKKLVGNVTIPCPTLLEQNAIGTLFRVLNELITLHQRKLEKLQNLKKAMLEKMFI